jgi:hypothetical protein
VLLASERVGQLILYKASSAVVLGLVNLVDAFGSYAIHDLRHVDQIVLEEARALLDYCENSNGDGKSETLP